MRLPFLVDPASLAGAYASAQPFPHVVIDGLFPDALLDEVLAAFPSPSAMKWRVFDGANEKKLGFHHEHSTIAPVVRRFLDDMNSFETLQFLEALTGIEGLLPDPYFGGGGLHQIENGGFLNVHVDFNWHPLLRLDRRLNVLVYLNRDWREAYGGQLELWDAGATRKVVGIDPMFNRTVVFATTEHSYHGHPRPVQAPDGGTRKSVSLYYYSNGRPEAERAAPHDTRFAPHHAGG